MSDESTDISFADLRALRDELDEIDAELVRTIAARQALVSKIGELKAQTGHQTRDFKREKVVLDRARAAAQAAGLDPELATRVLTEMIRSSLQKQEQERVQAEGTGSGKRALIVGGAGRMGGWFVDFFHSQGYEVAIADPACAASPHRVYADIAAAGTDYDVIVIATTLKLSADVLDTLLEAKPAGLVFDVGSLKTPLRESLERLAAAGVKVTSLHPMFGPSTQLLAGKQVIFVDVGSADATHAARALFEPTMATCIDMDIDQHDRMISYVLGLSHAANIAFVDALANSGVPADELLAMSSPTFDAQSGMGETVVHENPHLYFEIQRLNDFGLQSLDGLLAAVSNLREAVATGDQAQFERVMRAGRDFFDARNHDTNT